jgi:dipeptidase E
MRLLLGSGGYRTPERCAFLAGLMRDFFGEIDRLLFVPYALQDHDRYVQALVERKLDAGYALEGIHRHADPGEAIRKAEALFIGGGNTFRLLSELYRFNLLESIRERVRGGMPYLGISAGTNVACPTIKTTNDMPITQPPSFDALGLVPFQINPHYFTGTSFVATDGGYQEHFGETRDQRIQEFHEMNDAQVVGLWEAGVLRIEQGRIQLQGASARIFRKAEESMDVAPGTFLEKWLAV